MNKVLERIISQTHEDSKMSFEEVIDILRDDCYLSFLPLEEYQNSASNFKNNDAEKAVRLEFSLQVYLTLPGEISEPSLQQRVFA